MTDQSTESRLARLFRAARREPLILFLLLGFGLYLLYAATQGSEDDPASRHIVVDREALAEYIQGRSRQYDKNAEDKLAGMPPVELAALTESYIREEAMYREALALGLEQKDYLIRQRLVQSLQFMFRNLGEAGEPTDAALREFYAQHRSRYAAPPTITFTHVFFDKDLHGWDGSEKLARRALADLNAGRTKAAAGQSWPGDRFAYGLNYADRDEDMIADQFGKDMARKLFAEKPDPDHWQGPFRSGSGVHLVLISRLASASAPAFDEMKGEVARDYREWQGNHLETKAIDNLVKDYDISLSSDVRSLLRPRTAER